MSAHREGSSDGREAFRNAGEPGARPAGRQPRRQQPQHVARARQCPAAHGDAGLKLTATNLEIGITSWVAGRIDTEGSLTVPARLFNDLVAGLPSGEKIELESDGGTTLRIKAGRYQTQLRGIEADEFPVIPSPGERPTTRVSQKELRAALSEVIFAAGHG
jgi:DNA polymerase III sliding clamp (beta) subunit (PCNA family)